MTALPTASGIFQRFPAIETNTEDATYAPDGLVGSPVFGLGGQPLQGNEIVAGGNVTLVSYIGPLLNSGSVCWVLLDCTGAAQQVAPATHSEHAMQRGQATGRVLATRTFTANGAYTPTPGTNAIDVTVIGGGGGGGNTTTTAAGQISVASGGSAGGAARSYLTSSFAGQTMTIGGGGTAGNAGGQTSFGNLLVASGGAPGGNGIAAAPPYLTTALAGGHATGGNVFNAKGGDGQPGFATSITSFLSGSGGSSILGGGGNGRPTNSGPGTDATTPGSGGGGALAGGTVGVQVGGHGAPGAIIVVEYS